jgi:hypothetical protein
MVRRKDSLTYNDPLLASGQATVVAVTDYVAGNGPHRGYFATSHPSGDRTFTSYEGVTTTTPQSSGPPKVTFEGKWQFTGGTGKFEGVTGRNGLSYRLLLERVLALEFIRWAG